MNASILRSRWAAALLAATLCLPVLAPAASADRGGAWIRYKRGPSCGPGVVRYDYAPSRGYYVERHSSIAPALVGFIGGLVVGSAIHSQPACPPTPAEYYWDPYDHERFASLDAYYSHARYCHHPRVVRVIVASSGECVGSYEYVGGRWCERDPYYVGDWRHDRYGDENDQDGDWDR